LDSPTRLFSFAKKNQKISVADFLSTPDIFSLFHLPISKEALQELQDLQEIIENTQVGRDEKDVGTTKVYIQKLLHPHL
jgi:hypothetical protein